MSRHTQGQEFAPSDRIAADRIAAFAQATEIYAEGLEDADLANVYWGKSLGLWQAFHILSAEEPVVAGSCQPRGPAATCGPRFGDRARRSGADRRVSSPAAAAASGGKR
jgi:hypothetical protein